MDATQCKLASMIVHLAEFMDTGIAADMAAARSLLNQSDVAEILTPGAMIPVTRSGESVAQILERLDEGR